jgi:hypothetical protein
VAFCSNVLHIASVHLVVDLLIVVAVVVLQLCAM